MVENLRYLNINVFKISCVQLLPVLDFESDTEHPADPPHSPGANHHVLDSRGPQHCEGDGGEGDHVEAHVVDAQLHIVPNTQNITY